MSNLLGLTISWGTLSRTERAAAPRPHIPDNLQLVIIPALKMGTAAMCGFFLFR